METGDPAAMTCPTCRHCHRNDDGRIECWRYPPAIVGQALITPPITVGGPPRIQWFVQTLRPPLRAECSCGEWERRGEIDPSVN